MTDVTQILLDSLRWKADMCVFNHFEWVWLRKCEGGITDCCLASEPCDHHAKFSQQGTGTIQ